MTIPAGTRLGTYEVTSHIGSGGMGEVYQAHDSKLGRDVAIKVLPEQFARDPERLARFQREAKMLAVAESSQHRRDLWTGTIRRHALPRHGTGPRRNAAAQRCTTGALPIDEALNIAKQIAEALVAAHALGITHRDLKPSNVMIVKSGIKVLDFGLARFQPHPDDTLTVGNRLNGHASVHGAGAIGDAGLRCAHRRLRHWGS